MVISKRFWLRANVFGCSVFVFQMGIDFGQALFLKSPSIHAPHYKSEKVFCYSLSGGTTGLVGHPILSAAPACLKHRTLWNMWHYRQAIIQDKFTGVLNWKLWKLFFLSEFWSKFEVRSFSWDRWHHPTRRDALWYFILFSSFGISCGYPNLVRVPGRISIIHHRHYWIWAD